PTWNYKEIPVRQNNKYGVLYHKGPVFVDDCLSENITDYMWHDIWDVVCVHYAVIQPKVFSLFYFLTEALMVEKFVNMGVNVVFVIEDFVHFLKQRIFFQMPPFFHKCLVHVFTRFH